jgi:N-dimethylarginine dimethylaminohydrolase
MPGYRPGRPAERLDDVTFDDELELIWGRRWGAPSMMGKLRSVLVRRPREIDVNPELLRAKYFGVPGLGGMPGWSLANTDEDFPSDLDLMRQQHDEYCHTLERNGVEVVYIEDIPDVVEGPYTRLRGALATEAVVIRGGAIIPRMAVGWKRGLEVWCTKVLAKLGVPILYTVHGSGIFEGRVDYIDPKTVLLGLGHRSNREGIRQVEPILRMSGVQEITVVEMPADVLTHLCMVFTVVAHRLAIVYPPALPYELLRDLEKRGMGFIEVPKDEAGFYPSNAIALAPGKLVMQAGAPKTVAALRGAGVEVIEVDMSEIMKRGAGPTCITMSLIRDDGPYLDDE